MRLIDADALKEKYFKLLDSAKELGTQVSPCFIDNAPTVLHDNYSMGYQDGVKKVLLERPQGKWIPVSERLPEDAFGCLVTIWDTDRRTQEEYEYVLPYAVGYDGETWNDCDGEVIPYEVIAWMPLPEAYKEEENEDSN